MYQENLQTTSTALWWLSWMATIWKNLLLPQVSQQSSSKVPWTR